MSVVSFPNNDGVNLNVSPAHIVLWYFEDDRLHITPSTGMGKLTSAPLPEAEQTRLQRVLEHAVGGGS